MCFGTEGLVRAVYAVMADRGHALVGRDPLQVGMQLMMPPVSPTANRKARFSHADKAVAVKVARLRIHVDRSIGLVKMWRDLSHKFLLKKMPWQVTRVRGTCKTYLRHILQQGELGPSGAHPPIYIYIYMFCCFFSRVSGCGHHVPY